MRGRSWTPRTTAWLTLAGVSLIAGVISYYHGLMVVSGSNGGWLARWIVDHAEPALADLVITGASANLLDAYRQRGEGEKLPKLSMVSAGIGAAVTLYFNVAAGHPSWVPNPIINGWPPVAFGLALESLLGLIRRGRGGATPDTAPAASGHDETPPDEAEPPTTDEALEVLLATASRRALAEQLGVPKYRVETWAARFAEPSGEPEPELVTASMNGSGHGAAGS